MKINTAKMDLYLAKKCMNLSELRSKGIATNTLTRARRGQAINTATVGKIAKALGVDPVDIIEMED